MPAPSAGRNTNILQDITDALQSDYGLWSTPAYWNGNVYMWAENDSLKMFPLTNGVLATRATCPIISHLGVSGGHPGGLVEWHAERYCLGVETDLYTSNGSSILYAFNATNVARNSMAATRIRPGTIAGPAIKFTVPVVTNGKVYVGAGGQVDVYGLLNGAQQAPAPVISPAGGTYSTAQQITLTDTLGGVDHLLHDRRIDPDHGIDEVYRALSKFQQNARCRRLPAPADICRAR